MATGIENRPPNFRTCAYKICMIDYYHARERYKIYRMQLHYHKEFHKQIQSDFNPFSMRQKKARIHFICL